MKRSFLSLVFALSLWLLPSLAFAQQNAKIYLVDGTVVQGQVVEYVPGDHITIALPDGQQYRYDQAQYTQVQLEDPGDPMQATQPAPYTPQPTYGQAPAPSPVVQAQPGAGDPMGAAPVQQRQERVGPQRRVRANVYGTILIAGSQEVNNLPAADPDPSFGGGLRLEIALGDFIALGPTVGVASFGDLGIDYVGADAGIWVKGRYVIDTVARGLELYGGFSIGFSGLIPDSSTGADALFGFSTSVLLGGQLFFTKRLGLLLEVGFNRRQYFDTGFDFTRTQGQLNIGVSFAF